jgi:hypothetical protein
MIAVLAFLAAADPVAAQTAAATQPPAAAASPAAPAAAKPHDYGDKMVCRSIANTGTRFTSRDCRTQAQWDQLTADSKQATWDVTTRQMGGPKQ